MVFLCTPGSKFANQHSSSKARVEVANRAVRVVKGFYKRILWYDLFKEKEGLESFYPKRMSGFGMEECAERKELMV